MKFAGGKAVFLAMAAMAMCMGATIAEETGKSAVVQVTHSDAKTSVYGSLDFFIGRVRIDDSFRGTAPSRLFVATVTFEPGARTAWHTHALGQTLIVTSGFGYVQQWGAKAQAIRSGDSVWIPPGVKHWHGASPTSAMSHIAIVEIAGDQTTVWMEKVDDAQYGTACANR